MDWTNLCFIPVFCTGLWLHAAVAEVEPPTNVTLHCHNLHNVLKWNYGQFLTGLRFKVTIGSTLKLKGPAVLWVNASARQVDLSFLSARNEYLLGVTAVINESESESVPQNEITFSYFKDSFVEQKCSVDLPRVNVVAQQDAKVLFSFTHPWMLYSNTWTIDSNRKHRKRKSYDYEPETEELPKELPEFEYTVTMNQRPHSFICVDSVCEETLPVDAKQEKHCLKINGVLERMTVEATQPYCTAPFTEKSNYTIYIVLGLLAIGAVVFFVLGMICWKITNPSEAFPLPIDPLKPKLRFALPFVPKIDAVTVQKEELTSPTRLLSEETEQTDEYPPIIPGYPADDKPAVDEGVYDEKDQYTGGNDIDVDDTPVSIETIQSGYEGRPVIVSLTSGDPVEGYRG